MIPYNLLYLVESVFVNVIGWRSNILLIRGNEKKSWYEWMIAHTEFHCALTMFRQNQNPINGLNARAQKWILNTNVNNKSFLIIIPKNNSTNWSGSKHSNRINKHERARWVNNFAKSWFLTSIDHEELKSTGVFSAWPPPPTTTKTISHTLSLSHTHWHYLQLTRPLIWTGRRAASVEQPHSRWLEASSSTPSSSVSSSSLLWRYSW